METEETTTEEITEENPVTENTEDSTEELLERYDRRTRRKADDIPAMQTVVCVITAVLLFGLNAFYPETCGEIFTKLKELAFSSNEIFPNPIDLITELL
ncbi:MAG: hypothetical protein K2K14_03625 [Ruminococcus sp.]|nr:hypothetical protein [Ruminococcus sp.]